MGDLLIRHARIQLHHQFRIAANPSTVEWLEKLIQEGEIGPVPVDHGKRNPRAAERGQSEWVYEPFDLRIFDSPVTLMDAIRAKARLQANGAAGRASLVCSQHMTGHIRKRERILIPKISVANGV